MSLRLIRFWVALLKDSPWLQGTSRQISHAFWEAEHGFPPKYSLAWSPTFLHLSSWDGNLIVGSWEETKKVQRCFLPWILDTLCQAFLFRGLVRQREWNPTHQSSAPSGKDACSLWASASSSAKWGDSGLSGGLSVTILVEALALCPATWHKLHKCSLFFLRSVRGYLCRHSRS